MKDKELQKKAEYSLLNLLNKALESVNKNDIDNYLTFTETCENNDIFLEYKMTLLCHQKHTCNTCIFYYYSSFDNVDKCLQKKDLSLKEKIYCSSYEECQYCWECALFTSWNSDDYVCEKPLKQTGKYLFDFNNKNECPYWTINLER